MAIQTKKKVSGAGNSKPAAAAIIPAAQVDPDDVTPIKKRFNAPAQNNDTFLALRVPKEEKEKLIQLAKAEGVSLTEYCKTLLHDGCGVPAPPVDYDPILDDPEFGRNALIAAGLVAAPVGIMTLLKALKAMR